MCIEKNKYADCYCALIPLELSRKSCFMTNERVSFFPI